MMHYGIGVCNQGRNNAWMHNSPAADPREIIRSLMKLRGFKSETELANRANVEQSAFSRFMTGKTAWLSTGSMAAIASTLGVTTSQLLGEVPLDTDAKTLEVMRAMAELPDHLKDVVVATSTSLAKNQKLQ